MPDIAVQTDREQKRLIRMAETISKALPYMRRHNDATFVVKYGGHAMTDPKLGDLFARDIVLMKQVGMNPIVVHGGGPQINKMLERVGIKSTFVNGLRVTDAATMEIVEMVLAGSINKAIVADINECGGIAVGICGKDGNLQSRGGNPVRICLFYQIQVPKPWTASSEAQRIYEALEQIPYAEEMGFESAWFSEHHFRPVWSHNSAPDLTLAAIGELPDAEVVFLGEILRIEEAYPPERRASLARRMERVAALGEPWISFFDPKDLAQELRKHGFDEIEDLGFHEIARRYFGEMPSPEGGGGHVLCARRVAP